MTERLPGTTQDSTESPTDKRRDFLVIAAQAAVAVGTAAALWPFLAQMRPHRGSPILPTALVDLQSIPEGETRLVNWNAQPVFVRHRSPAEIAAARAVAPQQRPDPLARNDALDKGAIATDDNRTLAGHARWLVVSGACTHLGCLLHPRALRDRLVDGVGWKCPCHASEFDLSGRVINGPALTNLSVPPHAIRGTLLEIGARRG